MLICDVFFLNIGTTTTFLRSGGGGGGGGGGGCTAQAVSTLNKKLKIITDRITTLKN